ncbi:MAG: type I DNA topoisomerase, partial [Planctomycetes bacterium]|nr:type I DNA topoisomerase [Planctomycetota bacterium]
MAKSEKKTKKAGKPIKKTAKKTAAKAGSNGGGALVIVESPAKAKTIEKYLGPGYTVRASMGHVRDLPERELGVDLDNDFEPVYHILPRRAKLITDLRKLAAQSDMVYLATDLDREGEAIAWHLACALELPPEKTQRVVFNEITKSAVSEAFDHPRTVDMNKVDAQQARRVLDRIVGYQLSPLLWTKIARGLSAGRVQSVAVRLIVEREIEIREFIPVESWRITGSFTPQLDEAPQLVSDWQKFLEGGEDPDAGRTQKERARWLGEHACFEAELIKVDGIEFPVKTRDQAVKLAEELGFVVEEIEEHPWEEYARLNLTTVDVAGSTRPDAAEFKIAGVQTRKTSGKPPGPLTTAAMQQAASSQLRFGATRTMRIAQQLYEGVDIGAEGSVGLITYMRTDSLNLSKDAVGAVRKFIGEKFGDKYVPAKPNVFSKKGRAQEAHEAIRPADATRVPADLKKFLTPEQFKLYELIWKRFVACQMPPSQWNSTTVTVEAPTTAGTATFRASGRVLLFDGFLKVAGVSATAGDQILPEMAEGDRVAPLEIDPEQHYTSPPPRFTEASLVKTLEAEGIGRPSTYAPIIQTIQDRGYVEQIDRRLYASDKGQIVTEKLVAHFPTIMDLKFTSHMEDELDKIEDDHLNWVRVLHEFYDPFKEALDKAQTEMEPAKAEPSDYTCEDCGKPMLYRWARTGRFLSCSGYPDCKKAHNIDRDGKPIVQVVGDHPCELCDKPMILRQSRHGSFLGCSGYPECTHTIPCAADGTPHKLVAEKDLEEPCESCGAGTMKVKRRGWRAFLGCDSYPKCKTTKPLPEGVRLEKVAAPPPKEAGFNCERCGQPMVIRSGR